MPERHQPWKWHRLVREFLANIGWTNERRVEEALYSLLQSEEICSFFSSKEWDENGVDFRVNIDGVSWLNLQVKSSKDGVKKAIKNNGHPFEIIYFVPSKKETVAEIAGRLMATFSSSNSNL